MSCSCPKFIWSNNNTIRNLQRYRFNIIELTTFWSITPSNEKNIYTSDILTHSSWSCHIWTIMFELVNSKMKKRGTFRLIFPAAVLQMKPFLHEYNNYNCIFKTYADTVLSKHPCTSLILRGGTRGGRGRASDWRLSPTTPSGFASFWNSVSVWGPVPLS